MLCIVENVEGCRAGNATMALTNRNSRRSRRVPTNTPLLTNIAIKRVT